MTRETRFLPWIPEFAAIVSGGLLFVATGLAYESREAEKSVLVLYGERGDLPAIQLRDGDGRSTSSVDVVRDLAHVSKAPVYGASSQFLDAGVIGGAMFDFGANGRITAELALKALRGEWVPFGAPGTQTHNPLEINFPAFRKADLPEWRLPKEAEILYRPPRLWETHRSFILIVAGAILFQATLIAVLVAERLWRRRAEASLRQSEQRMSLMLEASPNGVVLANEQGRVVLVNTRAEELFGYSRGEFIGQNLEILVPARFRSLSPTGQAQSPDEQVRQRFGPQRETFAQRKDGSEFPIEIGISPIRSKEGILVLAVITDVSARKRAEAEARRYHEELAHLSRVEFLGEMAGSLAHELNQPLTAIMNNASAGRRFIAKGLADMPKLDGLLHSIVGDVRRAGEIIRGIRSMVRKSGGARGPLDLNTVVADVLTMVHSDAVSRNCVVVTELQPRLPLVNADRVQLQQVLLNITVNAFDAMCHIPVPERRVIFRTQSETGGGVRVSVRDFGVGLPTENPQRIFDRFFSTKRDGLGMGLAIARSIVSSHGGELVAENAEGGGAFVHFSLPGVAEGGG